MKKFLALLVSLVLVLALTACGSEPAAAPAAEPTAEPVAAEPVAAEPVAAEPTAAAEESVVEETTYNLDYDAIASWVYGGYIGMSEADEAVLLMFNEDMTEAGIIFADSESGDAASFFGEFLENEDGTVTINDTTNDYSITFGVESVSDTVMELDLGEELGTAQVEAATTEELLSTLQSAIENFNLVA